MKRLVFFCLFPAILTGCNIETNKNFLAEKKLSVPVISIITGTNETLTNTTVTLQAASTESDVSFGWSMSGVGSLNSSSGQNTTFNALTLDGIANIQCIASKDGRSPSDPASQVITVMLKSGQLPQPAVTLPGGTNIVGTNMTISLDASGSMSGAVYNWQVLDSGSITPTGDSAIYTASTTLGPVRIICWASKALYYDSITNTNILTVVRSYLTVTNNLILWLDAEDSNNIVLDTDNSNIVQWKDCSGLGNHTINNYTAGEQPIWRTNTRGGLPAVYFDGVNRCIRPFLDIRNYTTRDLTVICVFSHTNLSLAGGTLWQTRTNTTTTWAGFTPWTGAAPGTHYLGTNLTTGAFTKNPSAFLTNYWYAATALFANGSTALYINGLNTNSASVTLPDYYHNHLQIGRRMGGGAGNFYRGYLGEILIYKTALTPSERQSIERYLGKKWGIAIP